LEGQAPRAHPVRNQSSALLVALGNLEQNQTQKQTGTPSLLHASQLGNPSLPARLCLQALQVPSVQDQSWTHQSEEKARMEYWDRVLLDLAGEEQMHQAQF
jgi:hypothetical protein